MPAVRKPDKHEVAAILLSDIHLQETPPILRCKEPDWYEAMARPLREICALKKKHKCPVLCAGDVFDHWKASPELINFAIKELPVMWAIPGQHDLPYHNYEEIERSAYRTLIHAKKINHLNFPANEVGEELGDLILYGHPFGEPLIPLDERDDEYLRIALIHEYVWVDGYGYPTAPRKNRLGKDRTMVGRKKYGGYDIVVVGDNHRGFSAEVATTTVFNCGALMQRHRNELAYEPQVGLLLHDGRVYPHKLDTSADVYLESGAVEVLESLEKDMSAFFESLTELDDVGLDFRRAVEMYLKTKKTPKRIKSILIKAIIDSEIK